MGTLLEEFGLQEPCGQKHDVNMSYQKFEKFAVKEATGYDVM